jgi:hypothetical protein
MHSVLYTALQLGKAAVVSGSVYVIFKVVKTITPLPVRQASRIEVALHLTPDH